MNLLIKVMSIETDILLKSMYIRLRKIRNRITSIESRLDNVYNTRHSDNIDMSNNDTSPSYNLTNMSNIIGSIEYILGHCEADITKIVG